MSKNGSTVSSQVGLPIAVYACQFAPSTVATESVPSPWRTPMIPLMGLVFGPNSLRRESPARGRQVPALSRRPFESAWYSSRTILVG